ncbi:hypothetical protein BDV95DRAFT_591334 [Massariosphaeria phaeospora]|uniref:Uncharacterized protein n=1 Tax=Massariosphaeria phaeospora TaxID=100035 RepID=A0A7C8IGN1_9PLEO|nr:hypothetical protein BDV95DRAFT_591334 [Massariosphaeria phaeospora]
MATIQDPNFWKRFSTAVHLDDLAKQQSQDAGKDSALTHTYVLTLPSPSPAYPSPQQNQTQPPNPPSPAPLPLSSTIRSPPPAHRAKPLTFHPSPSSLTLTLHLSGRPPSRFTFWTSVTADPSTRDSWLVAQRRKSRQRAWICWLFWLGLSALVAGVVVAVLVLRGKGVI